MRKKKKKKTQNHQDKKNAFLIFFGQIVSEKDTEFIIYTRVKC